MLGSSNVIYFYDGTYDGLMCCVFASFENKEIPVALETRKQVTLFRSRDIPTDHRKALSVRRWVRNRISLEASEMIQQTFLSDLEDRDMRILYFIRLGCRVGARAVEMVDNEDVRAMRRAMEQLSKEAHYTLGLVRFCDCGGILAAQINPSNNVLPIIAGYFCEKYEDFVIYDKNHMMALIYRDGVRRFVSSEGIGMKAPCIPPCEEKNTEEWLKFCRELSSEGEIRSKEKSKPLRYRLQ